MLNHRSALWYTALLIAWSADLLFWDKAPGISFPLFLTLALGGLILLGLREGKPPHPRSRWLAAVALAFAWLTFLRQEPFTRGLSFLAAVGLAGLFTLSFRGGRWLQYNLGDYVVGGLKQFFYTLGLPLQLLSSSGEGKQKPKSSRSWLPYLRGVILALPVLAALGALLGAADPLYQDWLTGLLDFLDLERFPEYLLRGALIGIWTFLLAGLFLAALLKSDEEQLVGESESWPPQLVGITEAAVVLGGVNALFFSFLFFQFKYFFGGEENISRSGYTYAEYARRGFGELLAVAFFTLALFLILSAVTRRETSRSQKVFSGMTVVLTASIGIILYSSLQRLGLYEAAYGFSRLRTYAHLCMLWIGFLFLGLLVLEITGRWGYFTTACLASVLGFILTLSAVNVDGLITDRNLTRAADGAPLDASYLETLSHDAVPRLIEGLRKENLNPDQQEELGAVLACRAAQLGAASSAWPSFTLPPYRARRLLDSSQELWEEYTVFRMESGWGVLVGGDVRRCRRPGWD